MSSSSYVHDMNSLYEARFEDNTRYINEISLKNQEYSNLVIHKIGPGMVSGQEVFLYENVPVVVHYLDDPSVFNFSANFGILPAMDHIQCETMVDVVNELWEDIERTHLMVCGINTKANRLINEGCSYLPLPEFEEDLLPTEEAVSILFDKMQEAMQILSEISIDTMNVIANHPIIRVRPPDSFRKIIFKSKEYIKIQKREMAKKLKEARRQEDL